uniref:Uncharacterized protein n=1 Tax=Craspedostauros australis TaxID=1486917 RepID=A0A7R9ZLX3_9STRA|mmetsp:Transcript_18480/g.51372  ORF Transcript_18480/g.51372 Transcript_18480/m.51372 type:complete len:220 (+) Transcript_18480:364-1023(+)
MPRTKSNLLALPNNIDLGLCCFPSLAGMIRMSMYHKNLSSGVHLVRKASPKGPQTTASSKRMDTWCVAVFYGSCRLVCNSRNVLERAELSLSSAVQLRRRWRKRIGEYEHFSSHGWERPGLVPFSAMSSMHACFGAAHIHRSNWKSCRGDSSLQMYLVCGPSEWCFLRRKAGDSSHHDLCLRMQSSHSACYCSFRRVFERMLSTLCSGEISGLHRAAKL